MKRMLAMAALVLAGCAAPGSGGLRPGEAGLAEVRAVFGPPTMEWTEADGSRQLAYPRGPMGVHTYMVRLGPDGKLRSVENVMDWRAFARVEAGMSQAEVLRLLGPSVPAWTVYFSMRDELAWEWRYCDDWGQLARFDVLFDNTRKTVRSTMSLRESQVGECGGDHGGGCWCAR